ncbi:MAG TPA: histidine kinase dimerization/phospho-acceptor domain-containing protein [Gaiellaceae bacterium]|nr:histidine kinase dimerization/phospho-acceptor domain-containing protein [Gaiellaceae bacterium]
MTDDTSFSRLATLACHDLRTPLATVHGFARTLEQSELQEPAAGYTRMIAQASRELAELIDELALAARIDGGRYDPVLREVDSLELARSAAERLGEDRVVVGGSGEVVRVDPEPAARSVAALAQSALRHGGIETVELAVEGRALRLFPVARAAAPVVLGEQLRDLGAGVAVRHLRALGSTLVLDGETLVVSLPV